MMLRPLPLFLAAALALPCAAAFAATADVKFINPDRMSDLATDRSGQADTMQALTRHLQRLAAKLPADQVLRVEFTDVDLAGTWRATSKGRVRTLRNSADAPRLQLRYALESNGQVLRQGEETLTDLDYTSHVSTSRDSTPLYYEKRLLDAWFARDIGRNVATSR